MVNVENVEQLGAYVSLLEYDGIEGMVLLSELSRRRIRSVNKLIRVGRKEAVLVLRVDSKKGYVDLSKRRVVSEDKEAFEARYNKSKAVHSILYNVAKKKKIILEDLYDHVGWPLYEKFGHAYEALKLTMQDEDRVFEAVPGCSEDLRAAIMREITLRMATQAVKVRADIEVTCFAQDGIDAIKEALMEGKSLARSKYENKDVGIQLVAPPRYIIFVQIMDAKAGIEMLESIIDVIGKRISEKKGRMVVKIPPRITSKQDDVELNNRLKRIAADNAEVDGDDD